MQECDCKALLHHSPCLAHYKLSRTTMAAGALKKCCSIATVLILSSSLHDACRAQEPLLVRRAAPAGESSGKNARALFAIAVRDVDEPTVALNEATIFIRSEEVDSSRRTIRRLRLTGTGEVSDTISPGEYLIRVFRPGFSPYQISFTAMLGCKVSVEVYLSRVWTCLHKCESTPPRSTVTTCRPSDH